MASRPRVVTLVAVFLSLAAVVAVIASASLLVPGALSHRLWALNPPAHTAFAAMGRASSFLLLGVAVAAALAAAGLMRGWPWAWWLSQGIFAANALGDLVNLLLTRNWIHSGAGLLVGGVFLMLLLRADVRLFFAAHG